jgi:hypothetical protein
LAGTVLTLSGAVATVGQFAYARRLAVAASRIRMARETTVVMFGNIVPFVVVSFGGVAVAMGVEPSAYPLVEGVLTVLSVGAFVFVVWYAVLLLRYRSLVAAAFVTDATEE